MRTRSATRNVFNVRLFTFVTPIMCAVCGHAESLLVDAPQADDFRLVTAAHSAAIYVAADESKAVHRASIDLLEDVERVTGIKPLLVSDLSTARGDVVIAGTIGHPGVIDGLIRTGKIDVNGVRGEWESFVIQTVSDPFPNVAKALVIAGSDRRGAIYGIYEISQTIGVSPWTWWADVPVKKQASLSLRAGIHKQASPAVKYRGIFLNDEDWGLQPWAAKTFEPETGDIGPKTYAKIFELLLRLRGNYLWPAMHPCTHAFNFYPQNRMVADEYGIVMGSSHCEQMLRDNVDEWHRDGKGDYNYKTNREGVLSYWEARVKENGSFENLYTVGMRGIHDGGMPGGGTIDEKTARLKTIIADQRELLRKNVNPEVALVPQIFCPYKEVLELYRHSFDLPDDISLVWPDDNYGYVRQFSNEKERQRRGGAGVYYHLSYWGTPYDYLWLYSTPPALIWEEMTKAWDYGARNVWIANVGDLKPGELGMEFFLQLAWNPLKWTPDNIDEFLLTTFTRDFGQVNAKEMASILREYYHLNFQRRPEHMGFDSTKSELAKPIFSVSANQDETQLRLDAFAALRTRAEAIYHDLPAEQRAAYYQLVLYPVRGAALMNEKGLNLTRYYAYAEQGRASAGQYLERARQAFEAIHRETDYYNRELSGGKWALMMSDNPRQQGVFGFPQLTPPTVPEAAILGAAPEGIEKALLNTPGNSKKLQAALPGFNRLTRQVHFVDVFNGGQKTLLWKAETDAPWIHLSQAGGSADTRIWVSIDWATIQGNREGSVRLTAADAEITLRVILTEFSDPAAASAHFVEDNGVVVIRATHASARHPGKDAAWATLRGLGYDGEAALVLPTTVASQREPTRIRANSPLMEYNLWIQTPREWRAIVRTLPSWSLKAGQPQSYAISFDEAAPEIVSLPSYTGENDRRWQHDVLRNATLTSSRHKLSQGMHTLKLWMVDPGIVFDSILLDSSLDVASGYLWPRETRPQPPSYFAPADRVSF